MPQQLTAKKVQSLSRKAGMHRVAFGLYLRVTATLRAYWMLRYHRAGKSVEMSLGSYDTLSFQEAVAKSTALRLEVKRGKNPLEAKQASSARRKASTFKEIALQLIEDKRSGWKSEKHAQQWTNTLETYAFPVIGNLDVSQVEVEHVLKILSPIWTTKTETATRVRQRIEAVLDAAAARKLRSRENPAVWDGHLNTLLPTIKKKRRVKHHPAMPWQNVPAFMADMRQNESISAKALEFCILTNTRTKETIHATWDEIDFDEALWVIPASRMKGDIAYRVPLSNRAIKLLKSIPRVKNSNFIFNNPLRNKPLSNMAMLELLKGTHPDLTVHGFRSSFRDWAAECAMIPHDLAEKAMSHQIRSEAEAAYQRGDMLLRRRKVMASWERYLSSEKTSKVVPIKAGQR